MIILNGRTHRVHDAFGVFSNPAIWIEYIVAIFVEFHLAFAIFVWHMPDHIIHGKLF